jgi:hypothetical protein
MVGENNPEVHPWMEVELRYPLKRQDTMAKIVAEQFAIIMTRMFNMTVVVRKPENEEER